VVSVLNTPAVKVQQVLQEATAGGADLLHRRAQPLQLMKAARVAI